MDIADETIGDEKKKFQFPQIPFGILIIGGMALFLFLPQEFRDSLKEAFSKPSALQQVQREALGGKEARRFVIPPERIQKFDVYSPETREVEGSLESGELVYGKWELEAMAPLVAGRRVASLGRTSSNEISEVVEIYADFQMRVKREISEGSKESVRELRNQRMAEACGRVSVQEMTQLMKTLDQQLQQQLNAEK